MGRSPGSFGRKRLKVTWDLDGHYAVRQNGRHYQLPRTGNTKAPGTVPGELISGFLIGSETPALYLERIKRNAGRYNGFNLLVGDTQDLFYYSNRGNEIVRLESNIYGLSNRLLDTQWPKVKSGKKGLNALLDNYHHDIPPEQLLKLLQNQDIAPDDQLPNTGVSKEWEQTLSPIFIASPDYGTRCSTILTIDRSNHVKIIEHTWQQGQPEPVLQENHAFDFVIGQ